MYVAYLRSKTLSTQRVSLTRDKRPWYEIWCCIYQETLSSGKCRSSAVSWYAPHATLRVWVYKNDSDNYFSLLWKLPAWLCRIPDLPPELREDINSLRAGVFALLAHAHVLYVCRCCHTHFLSAMQSQTLKYQSQLSSVISRKALSWAHERHRLIPHAPFSQDWVPGFKMFLKATGWTVFSTQICPIKERSHWDKTTCISLATACCRPLHSM